MYTMMKKAGLEVEVAENISTAFLDIRSMNNETLNTEENESLKFSSASDLKRALLVS